MKWIINLCKGITDSLGFGEPKYGTVFVYMKSGIHHRHIDVRVGRRNSEFIEFKTRDNKAIVHRISEVDSLIEK